MSQKDSSLNRSQLDPLPTNHGQTDSFRISWDTFVKNVLIVTVQGYHDMYKQGIVQPNFEENQFTINLEDCIRPLAEERAILIESLTPIYTPEMKLGEKTVKKAKEVDLKLFGVWRNQHLYHFVWECKKIAAREKYKDLVYDYVTDGMVRFLNEEWKYANYVDDSGMLGYVLAGEVPDIVNQINLEMLVLPRPRKSSKSKYQPVQTSLSSYRFTISDHLKQVSPIGKFTYIYHSLHNRAFCGRNINLYHLFLTFDFDQ